MFGRITKVMMGALLLVPMLGNAQQTTVSFQEGIDSYVGTQDTALAGASPTVPQGANASFTVDDSDGGLPVHGLVRFENIFGAGASQIPPGEAIVQATLTFWTSNPGNDIQFHRMLVTWDEASTWDSMVGGISADDIESTTTFNGPMSPRPANQFHSVDVTSDVAAWQSGAINYGWFMMNIAGTSGDGGWDLDTSEAATLNRRPMLTVTYGAASPPVNDDPSLPADVTLLQGRDADLEVQVSGVPTPTLQWYKDGGLLTGETGATLSLTDVQPMVDDGLYYCVAMNSSGTITSRTATVTVNLDNVPPLLASGYVLRDGTVELNFDEDMDPIGFDTFGMWLYPTPEGPGSINAINFASATLTNGSTWIATTLDPITPGENYSIYIGAGAVRDFYGNNNAEIDQDLGSEVLVFAIDDNPRWRYDQSGTELVTISPAFYEAGFDDSAWPVGAALLGIESDPTPEPIRTPVLNTSAGGPTTTYYRTLFTLPGVTASSVVQLRARTVLDDGVVLYLNGGEAFRIGVPAGQNSTTFASREVGSGAYEGPFDLDPSSLTDGQNLLAGELHAASAGSSDNLFGVELIALVSTIIQAAPSITTQPGSTTIAEYDPLTLTVAADGTPPLAYQWTKGGVDIVGETNNTLAVTSAAPSDSGTYAVRVTNNLGTTTSTDAVVTVTADTVAPTLVSGVASFNNTDIVLVFSEPLVDVGATNLANYSVTFRVGGGSVAVLDATIAGDTVTLVTAPRAQDNYNVSVGNVTDLAETPNVIDPNPTVLELGSQIVVLDAGAGVPWRYDDTGADLGTDWRLTSYDDSTWDTGDPLFYMKIGTDGIWDIPALTRMEPTNAAGTDRIITYYFRHTFDLDEDPAVTPLLFRYILDDGAVFYVNGQEVLRVGMPAGTITNQTLAARTEGNDQFWEGPDAVPGAAFQQGSNLIAVEVHQVNATSSDAAFALQVLAVLTDAPVPIIVGISEDVSGNAIITHNGASAGVPLYIQEATVLQDGSTVWTTLPGGPHASPFNAGQANGSRFFQATDTP